MKNVLFTNILLFSIALLIMNGDIAYRRLKDQIYDDVIVEKQIFFTPLPYKYMETQHNQSTRGIKIVQADDFSKIKQQNRQFKMMARLFHIAAYYFENAVKVEKIEKNQTKLMNPPTNIPLPNTTDTVDIEYLKSYQTEGFDTDKNDLIIFLKCHPYFYAFNRFISGILQIQRRPIYGYLIYQFESGQPEELSPKVFVFHNRIQLVLHSMFHILGLNTQLFLKDPLQSVEEIVIDPYYQTKYYKNASSNQFKKQNQVIDRHPNRTQIRLKSQEIRKALYDLFSCENSVSLEDVRIGLATLLKNVTKENGTKSQVSILAFHLSNFYGLNRQIMQILDVPKIGYFRVYKVNLKISTITLAALYDTGYYQQVLINQLTTDYIPKQSQIKIKQECQRQFFGQIYDSCTGQTLISTCDEPKQIGRFKNQCSTDGDSTKWIYTYEDAQVRSRIPISNCQAQDLTSPKCLRLEDQAIINKLYQNQNCFDVLCVQENGSFELQVQKNERKYFGCKGNQTRMNIGDFFVVCPPNKDIFCKDNLCNNMCSERGLCIRGTCLIPPKRINYPQIISRSSIALNEAYGYFGIQNKQKARVLIPYGCLVSNLLVFDGISIVSCYLAQERYGLVTIDSPQYNFPFIVAVKCPYSCLSCRLTTKIDILNDSLGNIGQIFSQAYTCDDCQPGQFSVITTNNTNKSCAKCQSLDCTQCLQQKFFGIGCTNCLLGYYISKEKRCLPCTNLDNCAKCVKIKNYTFYKCLECIYGYQLSNKIQQSQKDKKILNKCIKCLPNCGKCDESDIRVCYACFQGYYLAKTKLDSNINAQCKICGDNCRICQNQKICQECYPQYEILFQNKSVENQCVQKCLFPCKTCRKNQPDNCTSCFDDYMMDGQNLKCKYANRCNLKCAFCQVGQGVVIKKQLSFESKCMKCNSSACLTCFGSSYSCIHCKPRFYLFYSKLQCRQCPEQCATCHSSQSCQICNVGYTKILNIDGIVYQNKCLPCTHNCATCTGSPNQCLTCKSNYIKIGQSCFPQKENFAYTIEIDHKQDFLRQKQYIQLQNKIFEELKNGSNDFNATHQIINIIKGENGEKQLINITIFLGSNQDIIKKQIKQKIAILLSSGYNIEGLKQNQKQIPELCLIQSYMEFKNKQINNSLSQINIAMRSLSFFSNSGRQLNCSQYRIVTTPLNIGLLLGLIFGIGVPVIIGILVKVCLKICYQQKAGSRSQNYQLSIDGRSTVIQ